LKERGAGVAGKAGVGEVVLGRHGDERCVGWIAEVGWGWIATVNWWNESECHREQVVDGH